MKAVSTLLGGAEPAAGYRAHAHSRGSLLAFGFAAALACLCFVFFVVRSRNGIWFLPFSDETEHLLGGRMLNAGGRLYETYVDSHGPVIFMLTEAYGAIFGWFAPNYARLIEPGLGLLAASSVALSPALRSGTEKLWGVALFLGMLATVWLLQGLYLLNFYPVGGLLAVFGLSGFLTGVWRGETASPSMALVAGVCFALLFFTAYSFGPSIILFAISACWAASRPTRRRTTLSFVAGGAIGTLGMLVWLLARSDLLSYLAFHIAFNQTAYAPFTGFSLDNLLRSLAPSFGPSVRVHAFGLLLCGLSCLLFVTINLAAGLRRRLLSILLGHAGILLLNARGTTIFQDGTFLIAAIGVASVAIPAALAWPFVARPVLSIAISLLLGLSIAGIELVGRKTLSTPAMMTRAEMVRQPRYLIAQPLHTAFFDKVRMVARPGEPVLALVYWPEFYWAADRLPMSGYYEYLPWDAAYAKSPWFGRKRDICVDLAKSPPPVVAFDSWKVWDTYAPADYMPCVLRILATKYQQSAEDHRLYFRLDRVDADRALK